MIARLETAAEALASLALPARSRVWKRMLDGALLLLTLPVWGPLMVLLALIIKGVSSGPVFFRQKRYGLNGRPFTLLKFRTMKAGALPTAHEEHVARLVTANLSLTKLDLRGDDRLIPLGRMLRATGLDELPQFLNVLRGQMSLVGPRPCTKFEYALHADWQKKRFQVLPGLTGLWQVSGKNKTNFTQMVLLDIHYAHHSSLGMDVQIMVRTLPVLWTQVLESIPHPNWVNREKGLKWTPPMSVERAD